MRFNVSTPSMPGIIWSRKIRSYAVVTHCLTASAPLVQVSTRIPYSLKIPLATTRFISSSSTTRVLVLTHVNALSSYGLSPSFLPCVSPLKRLTTGRAKNGFGRIVIQLSFWRVKSFLAITTMQVLLPSSSKYGLFSSYSSCPMNRWVTWYLCSRRSSSSNRLMRCCSMSA